MKRLHPRLWLIGGILAVGLGCGSAETPAGAGSASPTESSALYLVKIHADWCGVCTRLLPLWSRLGEEYGDSVRMVVFDVTDRAAVERSSQEAARLGLGEFFDAHRSRTGIIAVLDATTRAPLAVFQGEMDFAEYQSVLERERERGGA